MPVTHQWQRLTSAEFHDLVWWTIFSIAEIEYFPDEYHKHLRMTKAGIRLSSDVWHPTSNRILTVSSLWGSGMWNMFRVAFYENLSWLPYHSNAKAFILRRFTETVERRLIEAAQHVIVDSTVPLWTCKPPDPDFSSSSSDEEPLYVGHTSSDVFLREHERLHRRSTMPGMVLRFFEQTSNHLPMGFDARSHKTVHWCPLGDPSGLFDYSWIPDTMFCLHSCASVQL